MVPEPLVAVVDDDKGMRVSLDGLVRSMGYRTVAFSAAEDLLSSAEHSLAACVISDIQMPGGMDGIELTSMLLKRRPGLPVILISAFIDDVVEAAARNAGAFAVLKKPFVGESLVDAIHRAIG